MLYDKKYCRLCCQDLVVCTYCISISPVTFSKMRRSGVSERLWKVNQTFHCKCQLGITRQTLQQDFTTATLHSQRQGERDHLRQSHLSQHWFSLWSHSHSIIIMVLACYMSLMLQGSQGPICHRKHTLLESNGCIQAPAPKDHREQAKQCLHGNAGVHQSLESILLEKRWRLQDVDRWENGVRWHVHKVSMMRWH